MVKSALKEKGAAQEAVQEQEQGQGAALEFAKSRGLSLVHPSDNIIAVLDDAAAMAQRAVLSSASQFSAFMAEANAVCILKTALSDEMMAPIMMLQGNPLAFRTDKDGKGGYPLNVVRDCIIEAVGRGLKPIGNNFNIIAGRCYVTKEGFGTMLAGLSGLHYTIVPGLPRPERGVTVVPVSVEWTYNGKEGRRELSFPMRALGEGGMGVDALVGKATRKARAWLWQELTGSEAPEGDAGESQAQPIRASRLEADAPAALPQGTPAALPEAQAQAETDDLAEAQPAQAQPVQAQAADPWAPITEELRRRACRLTARDIYDYCTATGTAMDFNWMLANLTQVCRAVDVWKAQQAQAAQAAKEVM